MTKIQVKYDAYNRQFTLLDGQVAGLKDGESYVIMDFSATDSESDSPMAYNEELAHA